jgi:GNAT superfamily N-acetyltransferase
MCLELSYIDKFIDFYYFDLTTNEIEEKRYELKRVAIENPELLKNYFVKIVKNEVVQGSRLFPTEQNHFAFIEPMNPEGVEVENIVSEIIDRFYYLNGKNLICRISDDGNKEIINAALLKNGFIKVNERIEFKTPLKGIQFPNEEKSPLYFTALLKDGSMSLADLGKTMEQMCEGAHDFSEDDDGHECLKSYLNNSNFYTKKDCIQLGHIKDTQEVAAILIAQTDLRSGWSTITYMAISPKFRGKGFSKWIQRKGIEMMKSQGGIEYHGGTHSENFAMLKTFQTNGCLHFRKLSEWRLCR